MIRIALAEEHAIVRWALREALSRVPDLEIVGEAGTVGEALAMTARVRPEVLVIDTTMPDHMGFDVLDELRELENGPLVVVLSPVGEASYVARTIAAGAHAYVSKSEAPERLIEAIHAVVAGQQVVPPDVVKLIALGDGRPAGSLSRRELQVMEMLARGMTNREIAQHFDISIKTIDTHRHHILKKLDLRNNSDLTRFAVRHGYVAL